MEIRTIGIDLGKTIFHLVGAVSTVRHYVAVAATALSSTHGWLSSAAYLQYRSVLSLALPSAILPSKDF